MTLPNDSPHIPTGLKRMAPALLNTLFGKRSASVPPLSSTAKPSRSRTGTPTSEDSMQNRHCLRFWMRVCCECEATGSPKSGNELLLSPSLGWMPPFFSELVGQPTRPPLLLRTVSQPVEMATALDTIVTSPRKDAHPAPSSGLPKRYPALGRQRSVSQRTTKVLDLQAAASSRWIDIRVSDDRCLETLVNAFQSSQTQGLLSPHSIMGELDIDDRDEASQEAARVRLTATNVSDEKDGDSPSKPRRPEEHRLRGLNLKLSSSYETSNLPPSSPADSDDGDSTPILHTPILKDGVEAEEEERPARSKERKDFSHLVKTHAEYPEIHITPLNAFYYDRAHSASPARFSKAFSSIR
ncbi:hypothetical protein QFC22_000287 [Naganishia vaughanmartiniae]|uniref:Uncharacterized protein n=1 Tax=Naganishia vaughanmartiniae TaxID=1424756 RepID=A0ACC2XNY7_9TREE|nr:hypothetical protein QFC22_000287 [Naganishia vaughanmartiniae]